MTSEAIAMDRSRESVDANEPNALQARRQSNYYGFHQENAPTNPFLEENWLAAVPSVFRTLDRNADGKLKGAELDTTKLGDIKGTDAVAAGFLKLIQLSLRDEARNREIHNLLNKDRKLEVPPEEVSMQLLLACLGYRKIATAEGAPIREVRKKPDQVYVDAATFLLLDKDKDKLLSKEELKAGIASETHSATIEALKFVLRNYDHLRLFNKSQEHKQLEPEALWQYKKQATEYAARIEPLIDSMRSQKEKTQL